MRIGRYIVLVSLAFAGSSAYGQKEKLPNTNVPLNKTDAQGRRTGSWWISTPAHKGEPSISQFGNYDLGVKYGKWYTINHEGDITAIETFRDNMLDGEVKYYTNGILYCTGNYKAFNTDGSIDTIFVEHSETHEELLREIKQDPVSARHGMWRFYDETTGKLLREEEYQVDSLIYKQIYVSPADSAAYQKREKAMPHNSKKYRRRGES